MAGWLKLSREINNHWIWNDEKRLKWWIDILLVVNFEDKKVLINGTLYECKRGESLMSLTSWGNRWGVSKTAVNNFFELLKKDGMITTKNETQTTRLIVCKYDTYQGEENAEETQRKRKENAKKTQEERGRATTKEREELKELKELKEDIESYSPPKFSFKKAFLDLGVSEEVLNDWLIVRKNKKASNTETAFKAIKTEIDKSGKFAGEIIQICAERNWQGFKNEWLISNNNQNGGNKQSIAKGWQPTGFNQDNPNRHPSASGKPNGGY